MPATIESQTENSPRENAITDAQAVWGGMDIKPDKALKLANTLLEYDEFRHARRLLDKVCKKPIDDLDLNYKITHKRAVATYKDHQLNRRYALSRALQILRSTFKNVDDIRFEESSGLPKWVVQETLGLMGAIHKRMWENDGDKLQLEKALSYYRRGYDAGADKNKYYGYTGINTAFLLDLLAHIEQQHGAAAERIQARRENAKIIRREIIDVLVPIMEQLDTENFSKDDYWGIVTLAEAHFGVDDLPQARRWLEIAKRIPDENEQWRRRSTAEQLVRLAELRGKNRFATLSDFEKSSEWQLVESFVDGKTAAIRTSFLGKVGLALSGGGFRASFYHIGVLAKLAELDLLRYVEVLSCVSGGSIIGAQYYLELRKLFHAKASTPDGPQPLKRSDYINMVDSMSMDFLTGVQKNLRLRMLANPRAGLKMVFSSDHSRTEYLGRLYEKHLFGRVKDGESAKPLHLDKLLINPTGDGNSGSFSPRRDNWNRDAKVPELMLNATTLNSGHNWQFTVTWMGESPYGIETEIDKTTRYRRMYYDPDAPAEYKQVRLGTAVAASSCVPGLFEPIAMPQLYEDTVLRLVDGGVFDNLGTACLLEQDCTVVFVSDASGQLDTHQNPKSGVLGPLTRMNSVLMHRVRGAEYSDLKQRHHGGSLKAVGYVHLKQGLDGKNQGWITCEDRGDSEQENIDPLTPYGVRKDVMELLAGMRTDLDSFSDTEAFALMTAGYHATVKEIEQNLGHFPVSHGPAPAWKFLKLNDAMTSTQPDNEALINLKQHLANSSNRFFRALRKGATKDKVKAKPSKQSNIFSRVGIGIGSGLVGWALWPYMWTFDKWFMQSGKVK